MPDKATAQPSELRASLTASLSVADDVDFLRMLWSLNALQTGRPAEASRLLRNYPSEAATEGILGSHAIYPWELETLANELLTTIKGSYRIFNCRDWNAIRSLVNQLRAVENAEYGARHSKVDIRIELGRIGARQFPWQRGYVGAPALYRNAYIYGQGECAAYLQQSANLASSDITFVGSSLFAVLYSVPSIRPDTDMAPIHELGPSPDVLRRTLARIARPIADLRREALRIRDVEMVTAYKPSILDSFPACGLATEVAIWSRHYPT